MVTFEEEGEKDEEMELYLDIFISLKGEWKRKREFWSKSDKMCFMLVMGL